MGLNLSNRQIALELGLSPSDVQAMTEHLRGDFALDARAKIAAVVQVGTALMNAAGEKAACARMCDLEVLLHDRRRAANLIPDHAPPLCFGQHLVDGILDLVALSDILWPHRCWQRAQSVCGEPSRDNGLGGFKNSVHRCGPRANRRRCAGWSSRVRAGCA